MSRRCCCLASSRAGKEARYSALLSRLSIACRIGWMTLYESGFMWLVRNDRLQIFFFFFFAWLFILRWLLLLTEHSPVSQRLKKIVV